MGYIQHYFGRRHLAEKASLICTHPMKHRQTAERARTTLRARPNGQTWQKAVEQGHPSTVAAVAGGSTCSLASTMYRKMPFCTYQPLFTQDANLPTYHRVYRLSQLESRLNCASELAPLWRSWVCPDILPYHT